MSTETAIEVLAPGAGQGIGRQVAENLLAREGFVRRLADALDNGLVATRRMWDKASDDWIVEPDTRSQLQAAFGIFAHFEGDPIKRVIHELHKTGAADPLEAMKRDPQLLEAAKELIAKAEWHKSGRAKKAPKPAQAVTEIE